MRKSLELIWGGNSYPIKVTMDFVDSLDDVVNITKMIQMLDSGSPSLVKSAKMIGFCLRHGGCVVTDEEIYDSMADSASVEDVMSLVSAIIFACLPETKKKPQKKKS